MVPVLGFGAGTGPAQGFTRRWLKKEKKPPNNNAEFWLFPLCCCTPLQYKSPGKAPVFLTSSLKTTSGEQISQKGNQTNRNK